MAEIVNLRHKRKQKIRAEKEKQATNNRVQFGRGKSERQLTGAQSELAARRLNGKQREQQSNNNVEKIYFADTDDDAK